MNYLKRGIFLFSIMVAFTPIKASTFVDANSFAHMDKKEQIRLIDSARELASEIEERLKESPESSTYNSYYKNIKTIMDLMVNSAHAQITDKHIRDAELCIYGGWISIISGKVGNKTVCTNPKNLNKSLENKTNIDPRVKTLLMKTVKAHQEGSFTTKCVGKSLVCAPHLYGYKSITNGKKEPFCGQKQTSPYNASMDCSRQVAKLTESEQAQNYLNIIEEQTQKGDISPLVDIFKVFYDICACKGQSNFIEKTYSDRMFEQRTCYSWMKQSQLIMSEFSQKYACEKIREVEPSNTEFKNLFKWLVKTDKNLEEILEPKDDTNALYFEKLRTNKITEAEFRKSVRKGNDVYARQQNWKIYRENQYRNNVNQCKALWDDPEEEPIEKVCEIVIAQEYKDGKGEMRFQIKGQEITLGKLNNKFSFDPEDLKRYGIEKSESSTLYTFPEPKEDKTFIIRGKHDGDGILCRATVPGSRTQRPISCTISEVKEGIPEGKIGFIVDVTVRPEYTGKRFEINHVNSSDLKGFQKVETEDESYKYYIDKDQGKEVTLDHGVSLLKISKNDKNQPISPVDIDLVMYGESCKKVIPHSKIEIERENDKLGFKVAIKLKEEKDKTATFSIEKLTDKDGVEIKNMADFSFSWFSVGKTAQLVDDDKEKIGKDAGMKDIADTIASDKEVSEGEGDSIVLPKQKEKYDVYVKATKNDSKEVQDSNILQVPTIAESTAPPVQNNRNPALRQRKQFQPIKGAPNRVFEGNF